MTVRRICRLLLAVLVTAGLSFAPFTAAPAAEHSMAGATMQMAADASGAAADMPCCRDQQKSNDCQDCPLVAICAMKVLQAMPSADALVMREVRALLHPSADVVAAGLTRPPPDRPPRYLA